MIHRTPRLPERALPPAMALATLTLILAGPALALPLYASREGKVCSSCHFDPNGGGLRNDHGFRYAKNRHSMEEEERWASVTVDPQLNDWIRLGLDTRVMYVASHVNGGPTLETSTFLPMEGQLRVAVTPHDQLSIVGTHGIVVDAPGFPTPYVARELYGLMHGLPMNFFLQVGRFRLPFGLRQDDHTSFVRETEFLTYDSRKEDAGIAVGSVSSTGWFEFSFTNGDAPFFERAQTIAGKIAGAFSVFQGGVSGFHRYSDASDKTFDRVSGYASATRGPFTVLGELAGGRDKTPSGNREPWAAFGELNYRVSRGLNVRGKVDWMDRDEDTGGDEVWRYLIETDVAPMPFSEVKLSFRYYDDDLIGIRKEYLAMLFMPF